MEMELLNSFKRKLAEGKPVIGPFMKTMDPAFVECAGHAGFDFVILDMEHGPAGFPDLQNLIRGAEAAGVLPVVRTCDASETAIGKALDLGAAGIQVPQVKSVQEGEEIVRAAKFYPEGERGVCRFVRAASYSSMPGDRYFREANENLVIMQVEGAQILENLDSILKIKGLDILFIGPYDLSQSLGVPGKVGDRKVVDTIRKINDRARMAGIVTGVFCDTAESLELWYRAGIRYLSYSVDVGIFSSACRDIVEIAESVCSNG